MIRPKQKPFVDHTKFVFELQCRSIMGEQGARYIPSLLFVLFVFAFPFLLPIHVTLRYFIHPLITILALSYKPHYFD
jgi:hypothetical protein